MTVLSRNHMAIVHTAAAWLGGNGLDGQLSGASSGVRWRRAVQLLAHVAPWAINVRATMS